MVKSASVLINLFDIHNEANIFAIKKIKPKVVIYIVNKEKEELFRSVQKHMMDEFKDVSFKSYMVSTGDINNISSIIDKLPKIDVVVNVTGGDRINSLILLNKSIENKLDTIYIDILNKRVYELGNKLCSNNYQFEDMNVDEMVNVTGADILMDSTKLSEKKEVIEITKKIYENLDVWYKYKFKLYDKCIFLHDPINTDKITINIENADQEERNLIEISITYLKQLNCINYKKENNKIFVEFLKEYIKGFIFKSGTWLEVLTNIIVKQITDIDDVKSGVVFLWNEGKYSIRNELDVLAVRDSVLICISCKDSEKYDENALNELDVYSKRLGGKTAKKILVATKAPCKQCVEDRAKAMGINLVILNKDINIFRNELKDIINKKDQ